jgi:hypothetical protein
MKSTIVAALVTLYLGVPLVCAGQKPMNPVHAREGPVHAEVRLDNEQVRATHIVLGPRERTPMHDVTERVVVWLTDAHLRDSLADGTIVAVDHRAGDVSWVPAQRHTGTNLSANAVEFIAIEIKRPIPRRSP